MCNSRVEKQDVFITQNAAAANAENNAYMTELKFQASITNILLSVMVSLMGLDILYIIWRVYRQLHHRWVQQGIHQYVLRRSLRRQRPTLPDAATAAEVSIFTYFELHGWAEVSEPPRPEQVAATPSPRFIKTHLPLSLLPTKLLDTAKVVYVARDPRDVAVSYYHFYKTMGLYMGDFKTFWNYFTRHMQHWAPFFEHLKEAWEKRYNPNLLFLFYEDLCKDLPLQVCRVAMYLNKELSEEQVIKLCDHLNIDNFKKNKSVNNALQEHGLDVNPEQGIIRKGKAGGWRDYFDADMTREADNWIADNLKDTDFRYPHLAT